MPIWQRLILTIAAMLLASFLADLVWQIIFAYAMPSYIAGLVGGLAALPTWELSRKYERSV